MTGYLNDENINSQPFINIKNKKYYRTGDIFEKKKRNLLFLK